MSGDGLSVLDGWVGLVDRSEGSVTKGDSL